MEKLFKLPKGIRRKIVLLSLAIFFIYFGTDHFTNPDFYLSIMPPSFPLHHEAVYISGLFEIIGGMGILIYRFRKIAGWGLFALLIAVYPANIYMAVTPSAFPDIPIFILYLRLGLQFIFLYWAYTITCREYN